MKKKILLWLFNKNRTQFEDFFIQDVFGDVPTELTENSMKFLLSGGTAFDKWMRVSSYSLQRKLKQPAKDNGAVYIGGLIFFKTLDIMISRLETGKRLLPIEETTVTPQVDVKDDLAGVDAFFNPKGR